MGDVSVDTPRSHATPRYFEHSEKTSHAAVATRPVISNEREKSSHAVAATRPVISNEREKSSHAAVAPARHFEHNEKSSHAVAVLKG
jgi:DNA-binding transcriptional regulator of glucitol operon